MHSGKGIGTLYVVSTPIGNLKDITLRALEVLKAIPVIACEDTRQTLKLLSYYGIKEKKLIPYHEHNEREVSQKLIKILKEGNSVALVSDAGTPTISDPGYRLVKLCREEGIKVIPVPGATAFVAALSASGFPTDKFLFYGFLPRKEGKLTEALKEISSLSYTVVSYESPHRLERTLKLIDSLFPDWEIGIYKEITKLNEEFFKGRAKELLKELKEKEKLKGEFVLIFPPYGKEFSEESVEGFLLSLKEEGYSLKEAVKAAKERFKLPKRELYSVALRLFKG